MNKITTHHSHLGIEKVNRYEKVTHLLSENVNYLKRLAYALGLEIDCERYQQERVDPAGAIYNTSAIVGYWLKSDNGDCASIGKYNLHGTWYLQLENNLYDENIAASF